MIFKFTQKLNINKFKEFALEYKHNLAIGNIQFLIDVNQNNEPIKYKLQHTKDISSQYRLVSKLVFIDELNIIYAVIPYPIKEKYGNIILKDEEFLDSIFECIPESFILKNTNECGCTEYITSTLENIIQNTNQENLNKLKPMIFPQTHSLNELLDIAFYPAGTYILMPKNSTTDSKWATLKI